MDYENYRFWIISRIESNSVERENGCIEYGGGELQHDYGLISITHNGKRKSVPAHRAMWMAVNNILDLPSNIYVRHKCDNPCCVNIKHLESGTSKQNAADCTERGRRAKKYRAHSRVRRFTDEEIISIRNAVGKLKHIAEEFDTTISYVSKIKNMKAKVLVK